MNREELVVFFNIFMDSKVTLEKQTPPMPMNTLSKFEWSPNLKDESETESKPSRPPSNLLCDTEVGFTLVLNLPRSNT